MDKKVYIKGDGGIETGRVIIDYLESLGGMNKNDFKANTKGYYWVDDYNIIIGAMYEYPKEYKEVFVKDLTLQESYNKSNDKQAFINIINKINEVNGYNDIY
jgi:hypothetical protein